MSRIVKDKKGNIQIFFDMAYERKDAVSQCFVLGNQFIEHFKKTLEDDRKEASPNHHAKEMQNWLNSVRQIVLKSNNKTLSDDQLLNWFFLRGSNPEVLFAEEIEAREKYKKFLEEIFEDFDVRKSLERAGIGKW